MVDDEAAVSASIFWALKPFGHTTKVVTDGEQALANLTADPTIELVITDHSMPRMSGLELVKRLRETAYGGKILVLSAHLSQQHRAAYDSLDVAAMLPKPFDVDALRQVIAELFSNPSAVL
ncbi:MAG TPA: response regulator [Chthoniobacterales bacterium]|nr:response regulator [Chthoniobacterales bacterium]